MMYSLSCWVSRVAIFVQPVLLMQYMPIDYQILIEKLKLYGKFIEKERKNIISRSCIDSKTIRISLNNIGHISN